MATASAAAAVSDWDGQACRQEEAALSMAMSKQIDLAVPTGNDVSLGEESLMLKLIRTKLVECSSDLEIQRNDPNSPLYSVKSFSELNLNADLLKGIYGMGFDKPSKIQVSALPLLLADPPHNLIAQSQSGTGKTAAFVIAMLSKLDTSLHYPQVLCLSPTYELALQTGKVVSEMARYMTNVSIKHVVRGQEMARGSTITDQIIIGTPGKVLDWANKYRFFDLKKITVFVLDEADVMIGSQGHQDQSIRIHKLLSLDKCQMMLFSATYDQDVMDFAENIIPDPIIMTLKREDESLENIRQYWVQCENPELKYTAITNIYGAVLIGQAIIFCQTRVTASWLANKMIKDGHGVGLLSGELSNEERIRVLDRFRAGNERVLISTNVISRGIDVEQVTLVVNFDLPIDREGKPDCETYLHRIGRTGRFGKHGLAVNLVDGPRSLEILKKIESHFGKTIIKLDTDNVEEMEKLDN